MGKAKSPGKHGTSQHYGEYLDFAIGFAKYAGKKMKQNFGLGMSKQWKTDSTPVTLTDIEINRELISRVKKRFPDQGVFGEEEVHEAGDSEYLWVCDPVDGTIPFSHGIPVFVFGLALVRNGEVIVAVVYDPIMDRMFSATKGGGAFLNGDTVRVNDHDGLAHRSIALINLFRLKSGTRYDLDAVRIALESRGAKLMDAVSIIYFGCLVACGEFSATVFPLGDLPNNASVKLIVEEAGGRVTDLFGNDCRYDREWTTGHLVSNGVIHDELVEIIRGHIRVEPGLLEPGLGFKQKG